MTEHAKWKQGFGLALKQQDWALLPNFLGFAVGMGIANKQKPVDRPVFLYDASISYPYLPDTVNEVLAPAIGFIILLICLIPLEWAVFRAGRHWAYPLAATMRVVGSFFTALCTVGMLTEIFKPLAGRLRPDMLARCNPLLTTGRSLADLTLQYGTSPSVDCTNPNAAFLADGHKSFPSGHSSWSFAAGWYAAAYLAWCLGWRSRCALARRLCDPSARPGQRAAAELANAALLLLLLFALAWPWGVGVSRFRDNHHNISDVVGGFLLALTFVPFYIFRLVCLHDSWEEADAATAGCCIPATVPASAHTHPGAAGASGLAQVVPHPLLDVPSTLSNNSFGAAAHTNGSRAAGPVV